MPDISTVAEESDSLSRSWYFRDREIRTEIDTSDEPRAMQGISGGQGISPWSDLDVLTLDLVGQRLDIDQLLLPSCYQNTPY